MDASGLEHAFCWFLDHAKGNQAFHVTYRWSHYLSAASYVGLLAFLNLVLLNGGRGRRWGIGRELLKAVFALWRWAAMLFLFTGLNLLHMLYNFPTGNYFDGDKGLWMACGAGLGLRLQTLILPPLLMGMAVGGHGLTLFSWGWRDVAWTVLLGSGSVLALYAWAWRRARRPA